MSLYKFFILFFLILIPLSAKDIELEKVKLQLQWKYQFQFAGFIVAKEYGYYKSRGLDVELLEYQNSNIIDDIESGKVDYGINNSLLAYEDKKLNNVTLLATYFQRSPLIFVTQPEIKTVNDLIGKEIMMSKSNRYHSSLSILLEYFNLQNKVKYVDPSFDINDFINKKIDAVTAFRSNEVYELEQRGIRFNIIDPYDYGFSTNAINLFTSHTKVDKNPEQVKKFLEATKEGWVYALNNIEEVAKLIHKKYQPNKTLNNLIYEGKVTKELMLSNLYDIGEVNKEFVLKTFKQMVRSNKIDVNENTKWLFFDPAKQDRMLLTPNESEWIKNHPLVQFTGDPNWMPYESFTSDGEYTGVVAEYLKIIESKTGLKFEPRQTASWTESLELAVEGKVSVISGDAADIILNKKFKPVTPYSHNPIVIVMNKNQNYVENLNAIADKKIAIIKDYGYTSDIFKTYPKINFTEVENIQEGLEGVAEGQYDAMLATMALASYHISKMQLHNLKIVGKTPIIMDLTLFVSNDESILYSIIDKALNSITPQEHNEVINSFMKHTYIEKTDYSLLLKVSVVLVSILFFVILWNRRMKQEIEKRKLLEKSLIEKEKNLRNSELRYRTLFEGNLAVELIIDPLNQKIIDANESAAKFYGYPIETLKGMAINKINTMSPEAIDKEINRAKEKEKNAFNFIHKLADGSFRDVEVYSGPIKIDGYTYLYSIVFDVTKKMQLEAIQKDIQERLSYALQGSNDGLWDWNLVTNEVYYSPRWKDILGYKDDEVKASFSEWERLVHPDDLQPSKDEIERYLASTAKDDLYSVKFRMLHKDGHYVNILSRAKKIYNDKDEVVRLVGTHVDISEIVKAKQELEEQHEFLQTVIDSVGDGVMVINNDYTVTMMNAVAKRLEMESIISDKSQPKCYEISHHINEPCSGDEHPCPLKEVNISKSKQKVIHEHRNSDGEIITVELSATPLVNKSGEVTGIIESAHDITELIKAQETLRHQAEHDILTDLPNRILFLDRLNQAIKYAKRSNEQIAVLFLDLDHFKEINDSLGHAIGDELLKIVSSRLIEAVRQSDTVSRLGGDEFAIIIDHISSMDTIGHVVDNISKHLQEPYILDSHQFYVTSSIGISVYPNDGLEADTLLKYSDAAMYKAKNIGRNNYQFYTEDMTERAFERIVLETQLRQSLENNQMRLYYQIQVDAITEVVIGMEALIRWEHPEMGLVPPAKFLPLAEETGFIVELDEWVMKEGIKQFKSWKKDGLYPGVLSLNLTPKRLEKESFISDLKNTLKEFEIETSLLAFEVTEGQIMKNPHQAIKTLREIHDLGIKIAIDDFGTGYSSLSYLKQLPIDKLKIDQSFIKDIPEDNDDVEITRTIISMAKGLGLDVIAEGVENKEQKDFLIEHGCRQIQGYLYHKPDSAEGVEKHLLEQVL